MNLGTEVYLEDCLQAASAFYAEVEPHLTNEGFVAIQKVWPGWSLQYE